MGFAERIRVKIERKRLTENTIYRRVNLIYEGLWEDFLQTYRPVQWEKLKEVWMAEKAKKRLEEEERGLGELDEEMELEVRRGTEVGAAKYIQDFEERRAKEHRRNLIDHKKSRKTANQTAYPLEEICKRLSRRLQGVEPMYKYITERL